MFGLKLVFCSTICRMTLKTITSFFRKKYYRNLTISSVSILCIGIVGFHYIEGWSWLDSVDYAISTMVTTGNSGLFPKTVLGKYFNIFYMLGSVVLILLFVSTVQQYFLDREQNKKLQRIRRRKKAKHHVEKGLGTETSKTKNGA